MNGNSQYEADNNIYDAMDIYSYLEKNTVIIKIDMNQLLKGKIIDLILE